MKAPPNQTSGHPAPDAVFTIKALCHNSTGGYNRSPGNAGAFEDRHIGPNPHVIFDDYVLIVFWELLAGQNRPHGLSLDIDAMVA